MTILKVGGREAEVEEESEDDDEVTSSRKKRKVHYLLRIYSL